MRFNEKYYLEQANQEELNKVDFKPKADIYKSHSSGKKPNFDPKPQKSRNDSSYQSFKGE